MSVPKITIDVDPDLAVVIQAAINVVEESWFDDSSQQWAVDSALFNALRDSIDGLPWSDESHS